MIFQIRHTYYQLLLLLLISCSKETAIPVKADFYIEVENGDYSIPVRIKISNISQDTDTYHWTFEGGSPSFSEDKNPGVITYADAGYYTIRLEASNRDGSKGVKEIQVLLDPEIHVGFEPIIQDNNFSPMDVNFINNTIGANSYSWTFEGGEPSSSKLFQPTNIVFQEPGEHTIILEVDNGRETHKMEKKVTVAPNLMAAFDVEIAFEDDDFQIPVTMTIVNSSISATEYDWTFTGADIQSSTSENPTITFYEPGTHTLELKASNGKETQTISKKVNIYPNTNLRIFNDVKLGINTAHSSNVFGAFFSTSTRKVYSKGNVSTDEGNLMDIAFFGLDSEFTFNKFISPDQVQDYTFDAITNAQHTKFINLQESCDCSASLSADQFDAMEDDTLLESLNIEETIGGIQDFDDAVVPRIVLFETGDGRKGAIMIKDFVKAGSDPYIIVDIKVQKQSTINNGQ